MNRFEAGSGAIATNTRFAERQMFVRGMGFHDFIETGVEYEVVPLPSSELCQAVSVEDYQRDLRWREAAERAGRKRGAPRPRMHIHEDWD